MNDEEIFNPYDDDELFDDEYADTLELQLDNTDELYDESYLNDDEDEILEESEYSDAITEYLKTKGIDARSIKFENESGDIDEVDFNDLSLDEQLQILKDQPTKDSNEDYDLSEDEINLLNLIRRNGWSVKDYNSYISKTAIEDYNKNNQDNYTVANISDDELFLLDLQAKYQDISDEEKIEELEHAKQNPNLYSRKIQGLRNEYMTREQQMRTMQAQERQKQEQANMQDFVNLIVESINNHRYMDVGLGSDLIELSNDDMQDIYNLILGTDQAGNRYITNILNNPDSLVEAMWYLSKGKYLGKDIQDYYKHQITLARQNGYKKGYNDAKSGRQISSKAVVSKRLTSPKKNLEQTIYDLD